LIPVVADTAAPFSYPGPSTPQDIPRLAVPELERANPPQPFLGEPVRRLVGRDIFVCGELKQRQEDLVNPTHLGEGAFLQVPFALVGETDQSTGVDDIIWSGKNPGSVPFSVKAKVVQGTAA
jgi:hypothetical protein